MDRNAKDNAQSPKAEKGNLLPSTLAEGWLERLTTFYLIPEGPFLANWGKLMVIITVVNCILLSFMAAFRTQNVESFIISYAIDFFFLADIYIKFHVAYLQNGFWVVFPKEMAVHYLNSMEFRYDVACSLPFDLFALGWAATPLSNSLYILTLFRLAKMIRAARIVIFFRRQERKLHASSLLQILKFAAYLITLTHNIACMWFAIACPTGDADSCVSPSWASVGMSSYGESGASPLFRDGAFLVPLSSLYIQSVYWTVVTMTTTGYGDLTPKNDGERIFALITMTCGVFFYGYVSGTIASTLSNMDSRRVSYSQKMDAVKQYMYDRDMDSDMQERVMDYYDYMWERNKGIDVKNLFEDMPSTFRSEVALSLNNAIIEKANIFQGTSIGFRRMIAIAMKLYLFTANEYVIHKNDLGLEMYFITQGRIDIYSTEDLKRPTASLIEGAHFGEFQIALGIRHEYSARAVCNTDIYVLLKDDLELAFNAYPQDGELVKSVTQDRYTQACAARKSRQAAASAFEDIEEEFGTGVAAPTPALHLASSPENFKARKMSSIYNRERVMSNGSLPDDNADASGARGKKKKASMAGYGGGRRSDVGADSRSRPVSGDYSRKAEGESVEIQISSGTETRPGMQRSPSKRKGFERKSMLSKTDSQAVIDAEEGNGSGLK